MALTNQVRFFEQPIPRRDAEAELIEGLSAHPKFISPKFFYDERGSELFTQITATEEYYLTRTEVNLLRQYGSKIAELVGNDVTLLEYGSGNSEKIRLLLEALRPACYVPMDISRDFLLGAANQIASDFPWLDVQAACVDYSGDFELPFKLKAPVEGFFPGSSIGNFEPGQALQFLRRVRQHVGQNGGLVIGVDLKKDETILNRAYNDAAGVTAAFNLNVLKHINQEFGGNFDLGRFKHVAGYNVEKGCIQMFLESQEDQVFSIGQHTFSIGKGERIHTENSFKYGIEEFVSLCQQAGFAHHHVWTDEKEMFGLFYVS